MSEPLPPPRAPSYDYHEEGWGSRRDGAIALIERFVNAAEHDEEWVAPERGLEARLTVLDQGADSALIGFKSNLGDGRIELAIGPEDWVLAEVFVGDALWLRAWCECGYEEPELWPDGSDGEHKPMHFNIGEAGARMSKHCHWITFFHWPGWESFSVRAKRLNDEDAEAS